MRSLVILIAGVFSFFYIDLKIFRARIKSLQNPIGISRELFDQKEKQRRKQRKYKKGKYKRRHIFELKHYRLNGTNPKDNRYSNQRTLRRMFRND